jgi:hypothetical protein
MGIPSVGGGHRIAGVAARIMTGQSKAALSVAYSGGLESGTTVKYCHTLPSSPLFIKFLAQDRIGLPNRFQSVAGDSAEATDAKPRGQEKAGG